MLVDPEKRKTKKPLTPKERVERGGFVLVLGAMITTLQGIGGTKGSASQCPFRKKRKKGIAVWFQMAISKGAFFTTQEMIIRGRRTTSEKRRKNVNFKRGELGSAELGIRSV